MISGTQKKEILEGTTRTLPRRLPIGAEPLRGDGVHFRVWAPDHKKVEVVIESAEFNRDHDKCRAVALEAEEHGYFSGAVPMAGTGTLYRYRLDEGALFPDPASRFQPLGPHGPSMVVDPDQFAWTDSDWHGVSIRGQVIYEMHIGTFTREGTWEAAGLLLPKVAETGITVLEIMPVSEFPGRFGWGYDGVDLFAPTRLYGSPDDFRKFVAAAHGLGLGVILDVVYNHHGPEGCYLQKFSEEYFTDCYETEWGEAFNFSGRRSGPVREFVLANARYWIQEFHLDGLRLDATQSVFDRSSNGHILGEITRTVRESGRGRSTIVIAENEPQQSRLVRAVDRGGYGMDALWNDDFHHAARVALTGKTEAYYTDYRGTPQEFISAVKWGYLYQGQYYRWQKKARGTPAFRLPPESFVLFLQNHDQISNSRRGERLHLLSAPGRYRALTALMLLAPATPMLFQGQEFAASSPFLYFADQSPEIAAATRKGRTLFLEQFAGLASPEMQGALTDPLNPETFERCKLDFSERERHTEAYELHRDLLKLRSTDPVFSSQAMYGIDGALLGQEAFVLRYFEEQGEDRLLVVNLGRETDFVPSPEPLLAPPENATWRLLWSSEHPRYGGSGTPPLNTEANWHIPAACAIAFLPQKKEKGYHE